LAHLGQLLASSEGPFDGAIGFSQGACLTGLLCSVLERGRVDSLKRRQAEASGSAGKGQDGWIDWSKADSEGLLVKQPPLKFGVSYSGFAAAGPRYQGFYDPKIQTPMLHFIGSVDTVVEETRSLKLAGSCADHSGGKADRVVYHPGGHFLPSSQKPYVAALVAFIREIVESQGAASGGQGKEETVEDMDVPF